MSAQTLPLPRGACVKCGRIALSEQVLGGRCANPLSDGPCVGYYRASTGTGDWLLCPSCHGNGLFNNYRCAHCDGSGWLYARPQFP